MTTLKARVLVCATTNWGHDRAVLRLPAQLQREAQDIAINEVGETQAMLPRTDQSIDLQRPLRLLISKDGNRFLLTIQTAYITGHRAVQHRKSNLGRDDGDGDGRNCAVQHSRAISLISQFANGNSLSITTRSG